ETVDLSATEIALGSSTINGGPARQSLVAVASTGATTVGKVNAVTFSGNGLGSFTATGAITTTNVASILSNGPVSVTTVTATSQPFGSVKINTPGAVTADSILAGQSVEIGGFFDSPVASVTVDSVEATTGSVFVRAGASDIGAIKSGMDTRILGTTATIGTVTAGGSYTVATTGNVTLGKVQGQVQKAARGVSITSTGGSISEGATGMALTSDSDGTGGDPLALTATTGAIALGSATLNGGPAKQSAVTLASGTTTTIGAANGRSITATGKGFTANREISSATDIAITVAGPVALAQGANAVGAIRLSATDAMIGGAVDARTIDITNSGSGNLVIGGSAASETGKFVLNRAETALLRATDTLTLGADGSDNVEIKQVDFAVPKTVRVLANGKRIDITGRISFGAGTTLKLGGSTDPNSIIRLQTGTGATGGSITSNGGVLELTAANIVGGTAAFANDLQAISGPGSAVEASRLNLTPGSSLYNNVGGTGQAMIDVGSMKVTFSNFAMFQNTSDASLSLLATGVNLGNGNPQAIALDIKSGATQPVFALFGSINGIVNAATALLGNPPLAHYDNISASRINGCVIGGGNCQSVQNLTPSLTALDTIRTSIFTVKPDFQVPFDPLVGTNNDSLFDDVGSFGLGELPMTPIECSDPNGNCEVQKKGGN
ncbi:MAG: hypothetical protein NTX28_05125, partial [Novosphingobium sp.]|nr:hypothetical protein [Novosphingobium sp.]